MITQNGLRLAMLDSIQQQQRQRLNTAIALLSSAVDQRDAAQRKVNAAIHQVSILRNDMASREMEMAALVRCTSEVFA